MRPPSYGTIHREVTPNGGSESSEGNKHEPSDVALSVDRSSRAYSDSGSVMSERTHESAQAGVKRLEAISSTWSKWSLYAAYAGIALLAYATSLESLCTTNLSIFATSSFKAHSLVSTVLVVQGVVLSIVKPPMSKVADVFGRFEAFGLSVTIYVIGYILQASSTSVGTYAAAQIFYAAGSTGVQILSQIFIADTSDLSNRALCSTIPQLPFLINVWIGPALAETILRDLNWRWGYGIWAIVLPVAFLPLALTLTVNQRKAAARGILPKSPFQGQTLFEMARNFSIEFDFFGLLLLCVSFTLILIPLTLFAKSGWHNPSILSMFIIGVACLIAFPFWERSKTLAPRAFFARSFWRNRTLLAGIALSFFYFMAFYLSVYPYFQSYLLVVQDLSVTESGRIIQTFTFTSTITAITISVVIKYTKRYKRFMVAGTCIYFVALLLMLRYRKPGYATSTIVFTQVLLGMGGILAITPAQLGVQASVNHQEVAAATAIFLTSMEIGGAVGSAISGAIWTANIPRKLAEYLPPETQDRAAEIYGNIRLASNGWEMGTPTRIAINRAYQETMTQILTVAVCVAIPVVILSLVMKNYKLDEIQQGVAGVVIGSTQEPTLALGASHSDDPSATRLLRTSSGGDAEANIDEEDESPSRNSRSRA